MLDALQKSTEFLFTQEYLFEFNELFKYKCITPCSKFISSNKILKLKELLIPLNIFKIFFILNFQTTRAKKNLNFFVIKC